jgi:hypothetical protein
MLIVIWPILRSEITQGLETHELGGGILTTSSNYWNLFDLVFVGLQTFLSFQPSYLVISSILVRWNQASSCFKLYACKIIGTCIPSVLSIPNVRAKWFFSHFPQCPCVSPCPWTWLMTHAHKSESRMFVRRFQYILGLCLVERIWVKSYCSTFVVIW